MRPIILEHSDYDSFNGETWTQTQDGYLLTGHIVLTTNDVGIWLYCFAEEIAEDATSAIAARYTPIISLDIGGASVEGMDLAIIARMSIVDLAQALAAQEPLH